MLLAESRQGERPFKGRRANDRNKIGWGAGAVEPAQIIEGRRTRPWFVLSLAEAFGPDEKQREKTAMKVFVTSVLLLLFLVGCASDPSTTNNSLIYVFCGLDPEGLSRIDHYCMDGPNR